MNVIVNITHIYQDLGRFHQSQRLIDILLNQRKIKINYDLVELPRSIWGRYRMRRSPKIKQSLGLVEINWKSNLFQENEQLFKLLFNCPRALIVIYFCPSPNLFSAAEEKIIGRWNQKHENSSTQLLLLKVTGQNLQAEQIKKIISWINN